MTVRPLNLVLLALVLLGNACSVRQMAVNRLGDALAGGGAAFSSDEDPELVKQAVPFGLKLQESLLAESPRHSGLLLSLARGFTQFGYAFVQLEADQVETRDVSAALAMRQRAQKLYLRARNYGLRGLDVAHPGFSQALRDNPQTAVQRARKQDVPLLYWTAAAWGAATAVRKEAGLIADQPIIEALMDRALVLDETYGDGAIHVFLISYELARRGGQGQPAERARRHFERARALAGPHVVGPLVSFAEQVCVQQQNRGEFEQLLRAALAINLDAKPAARLENHLMQQRAAWLLARTDELFVE